MKSNHLLEIVIIILIIQSCSLPKDTIVKASEIPLCSQEQNERFEFVKSKMEGVYGFDPTNEEILYIDAHHKCWEGDVEWSSINGRKTQACGYLVDFFVHDGGGIIFDNCNDDEYDWNLNIIPNDDYKYIIEHPKTLVSDREEWKTCELDGNSFDCFQAEITPDENFYDNIWFPKLGSSLESPVENQNLCVYGPWVTDCGHDCRPEIHPSELIWWREEKINKDIFFLFAIQDDSNRFDENSEFDYNNNYRPGWKPWAAPPMTSRFLIPFEYDPNRGYTDHLILDIEELAHRNVVTGQDKVAYEDSDNGNNHLLIYQSNAMTVSLGTNKVIEVNENISLGINLGVKFIEVCKRPDGSIIGYVQITTKYGIGIDGDEGYHVLKAILKYPTQTGPVIKG